MLARTLCTLCLCCISSICYALEPDIDRDHDKDMADILIHIQIVSGLRDPVKIQIGDTEFLTLESSLADVVYNLKILTGWIDVVNMITDGYLLTSVKRAGIVWYMTCNLKDIDGQTAISYPEVMGGKDTEVFQLTEFSQVDTKRAEILKQLQDIGKNFVAYAQ